MITKWLRGSGLVVNESKKAVCLFHKNDQPTIEIKVCGSSVKSNKVINVLGVTFDSKLNWSHQFANCTKKAKKSLFALKLLKKFFNPNEMRTLIDSHFYSVLYYNVTPEIGPVMKQKLLSISACALRSCLSNPNNVISFERIHEINKKCMPSQIMLYQSSHNLHKTLHFEEPSFEAITVLDQLAFTPRQTLFIIFRNNHTKIGMNTNPNKFY